MCCSLTHTAGTTTNYEYEEVSCLDNPQKFACMIPAECPDLFESHHGGCYLLKTWNSTQSEYTNLENLEVALIECNLHGSGLARPATLKKDMKIIEYLQGVRMNFKLTSYLQ